jgi:two-component system alkaline phosphatase synthesis response regulator PhoP
MDIVNNKKILLVDDEPDIIEFLSYNFRKKGYLVYTAYNGEQALEVLSEHKTDIIISDILMPKMDGVLFCKEVKQDENLKHIPIIFLSANADDYKTIAAMQAGGEHYVSKPVSLALLSEIVTDTLSQHHA